jgi:YVTN family beta-propeller protein
MNGRLHDIYSTPDGKYIVAGSNEDAKLTVVDAQTEEPVWDIKFDHSVFTGAAESNPDGSTRRLFVMTEVLHGFDVVDFAKRKVVAEIKNPDEVNGVRVRHYDSTCHGEDEFGKSLPCLPQAIDSPSHGIGVAPDQKTLWVNSRFADAVFVYSLPDLKVLGFVLTGLHPEWMSFSPDGKLLFDTNAGEKTVSVIDTKTMKEVDRIPIPMYPYKVSALGLP